MPSSYLFYDIESSGLNKCFDQVLQFAAIRTDLELNELARYEFLVKLNPDTIPTPQAFLVNQLSLEQLAAGIGEYEAITQIHHLFNTPGTITIGYNNLNFDDEFLRFSFYRNLFPPYTHQYANGCSRMDLYPITILYYLFKPELLSWPQLAGQPTLKLEHLSAQNNLTTGPAHNAMTDVQATLALARIFYQERSMWDYLQGYFVKTIDQTRVAKLSSTHSLTSTLALLIDGSLGREQVYQVPVIGLGMHHHYKNQSLWLSLDLPCLSTTNATDVAATSWGYRKRFGEAPILLPLSKRFTGYLSATRQQLIGENLSWINHNQQLFQEIATYYKEYKYPEIAGVDIDAALYQRGFLSEEEEQQCLAFHRASVSDKITWLDKFTNPQLQEQAVRLLGRNYLEFLPTQWRTQFTTYLANSKGGAVLLDYKNQPRFTAQDALREIAALQQQGGLNRAQLTILAQLTKYIQS